MIADSENNIRDTDDITLIDGYAESDVIRSRMHSNAVHVYSCPVIPLLENLCLVRSNVKKTTKADWRKSVKGSKS